MLRILSSTDADFDARIGALARRTAAASPQIIAAVKTIVADVRTRGDAAVRELSLRFEQRTITAMELSRTEWDAGAAQVQKPVRDALDRAAARIRIFHERQIPASYEILEPGIRTASRVSPLERVALYVPGGTARYPSTVLMTAIPAKVAGVSEVIMTTPGPSPETLAAASIAGVDRVFVIGGAQAVAALAYGTDSVPRVDKIVGPGNAYVTEAKRQVYGDVGIDFLAGPTEVVVAADDTAMPVHIAADLLAQAEHDALAVPILVAVGRAVADRVNAEIVRQLADLPRRDIARQSLAEQGWAIVVDTPARAIAVVNCLAPEHAGIALHNAATLAALVTTAGAVFVGGHAPEPVGDYFAGPSHVLPTGGSARFTSPLGVGDFVKRTSFIEYDRAALARHADDIAVLAEVEGLSGHARATKIRGQAASA